MFGLFETLDICVNPMDARALSKQEIAEMCEAQLQSMAQAQRDPSREWAMLRNWFAPVDTRPLDERFADFKKRLAAARVKYGMRP